MDDIDKRSLQMFGISWMYQIKFGYAQIQIVGKCHNVPNSANKHQLSNQVEWNNRHSAKHLINIDENNSSIWINVKRHTGRTGFSIL